MTSENKKFQVEFAPGCFDSFEGTQEELDAFVAEIEALAEAGTLFDNSIELTEDEFNDLDSDTQDAIIQAFQSTSLGPRTLN